MKKKLDRIVELPCEEDQKEYIASMIRKYLVDNNNDDYINGNIVINTDRFESVDVVFYEGCSNLEKLIRILTA